MKKKIEKIIPNSILSFLKKNAQYLRRLDCILLYSFYKKVKKQNPKEVLFLSDSRDTITGNFEFIYRRLQQEDFVLETFLKRKIKDKKTWSEKKSLMKKMATARYILVDDFYPLLYPLSLRKNTEVIQVWHALGAFKTVGYARMGKVGGPVSYSLTHRNYTAAIVSSEEIKKDYARAFGMSVKQVYATGIPRTDIFFDATYEEKVKARIYEKYPKLKNKKVILFAPTFRGNGQNTAYYDFSFVDFQKLEEELKKEYVFIVRPHPFTKNLDEMPKENDFYVHLTEEREINDLLFVTDVLITDYSSVIFEYSLLNRKAIFFVPDLKEYIASRDFFYTFDKYTYGEVAMDMNELLRAIKVGDIDHQKIEKFRNYFISSCDGHSTERFVKQFFLNTK